MIIRVDSLHLRANQTFNHNAYKYFYLPGMRTLTTTGLVNENVESKKVDYKKAEKWYNSSERIV